MIRIVAMALLSLGCARSVDRGTDLTVYFDDTSVQFSQDQRDTIVSSINDWSDHTDRWVTFSVIDHDNADIVIRADRRATIERERGYAAVTDYFPGEIGGTITLPRDVSLWQLAALTRHETGHAIGLDHDETHPTAVMREQVRSGDQITANDVAQFCEINDCDPGLMSK